MRSRSIRRALQERALRKEVGDTFKQRRLISLGEAKIEAHAVIQGAALERAVGDWFLNQLPKRAKTPSEAEALAPLLQTLQNVHDDHEFQRLRDMTLEEVEEKYGSET